MSTQRLPLYDPKDLELLSSKTIFTNFSKDGTHTDYVEFHVKSGDNVLSTNYNLKSFSVKQEDTFQTAPAIKLNIHGDIRSQGYQTGMFTVKYNFLRALVGDPNNLLYIDEISNDRKEIRIRPVGDDADLGDDLLELGERIEGSELSAHTYWPDLLLNFGEDELVLAVNWAVDYETYPEFPHSLVFKLYTPLPDILEEGDKLWIVQSVAEPIVEDIKLTAAPRGIASHEIAPPDFSIPVEFDPPTPTGFKSETDILAGSDKTNQNRLFQKLFSGSFGNVRPNIDFNIPQKIGDDSYDGFKNVVHFGSVVEKLENFKFKIRQLEGFDKKIAEVSTELAGLSGTGATSSFHFLQNKLKFESRKTELIGTFDDFEEHLYYSSQSYVSNSRGEFIPFSWPKTGSQEPYPLAKVDSIAFKEWYGQIDNPTGDYYNQGVLYSASRYDEFNDNSLIRTIPAHIRFSDENDKYVKFVNMVGDHYDQLYLYTKHLLDIHSREHPLYEGLAKKLLKPVLVSFGWKPYQGFDFDDLWAYNFGTDSTGNYGSNTINYTADFSESVQYAVQSQKSQSFSKDDIGKELWKRILNNLPYITKAKGTEESIRSLISIYGLPSTILRIHEYGGPQKLPGRHSKNIYDRFSYAQKFDGRGVVTGSWSPASSSLNHVRYPDTVQFRFNIPDKLENKKDMLFWNTYSGSLAIWAEHTSSYLTNKSQSLYGRVNFALRSGSLGQNSDHRYLTASTDWAPIYDNDWWSVMLHRRDPARDKESVAFTSSARIETHEEQDIRYELFCKKMSDFSRFGRINWAVSASLDVSGSLGEPSKSYNRAWGGVSFTSASIAIQSPVDLTSGKSLVHFLGGATESYAGDDFLYNSASNTPTRKIAGFSGSMQEFRLWHTALSESVFNFHVQSPLSIAANGVTGSFDNLLCRWSLGADLAKYNISHSYVISSSQPDQTPKFKGNNNVQLPAAGYIYGYPTSPGPEFGYSQEEERYFVLMPRSIGPAPYSEKIRIEDNKIVGQLHPYMKRERSSFDKNPLDSNKLGVYFSPTDEIDDDIAQELGPFEFDDFVGDPRDTYLQKYSMLLRINNHYWKKHSGNPSFFQFLKMLRYF